MVPSATVGGAASAAGRAGRAAPAASVGRRGVLVLLVLSAMVLAASAVPFGPEQSTERLSRRLASSEPETALLQTAASRKVRS